MIIKFNGETSINKLGKLIQEVVKNGKLTDLFEVWNLAFKG